MKYLTSINLNKNELQNAVIQNLATAPTGASKGQIYYDTTTNRFNFWNGTLWIDVSEQYIHPTFTPRSIDTSGVEVFDVAEVNSEGHITNLTKRTLPTVTQSNPGVMSAADKIKLDDIESEAKDDQTGAEIKSLYEGEANTNAFTDAEQTKLSGITAGATDNVGTVTSVGLSAPLGLTVTGSPITVSGLLALTFTAGYSIPTTVKQGNWDAAFGWGDHDAVGYLTAETDTLDSVTGRGASTTNSITVGGLVVNGDATITGTLLTKNAQEVNIGDAVILLNAEEVGAPTENAGIEIERGTSANVSILWDETGDFFKLTNNGTDFHAISRKFAQNITGTAIDSSFTVTHNLNSTDVTVSIKEATTGELVMADVVITNADAITVILNPLIANGKVYRITVIG